MMQDIFNWIIEHWSFCAAILAIFIQFTPAIKWNPISAFFGWIGKMINKPVVTQLAEVKQELKDVKEQQKADEKDRIRYEVLDFANSCRHGRRHTRDEFQHIVDLNDKYEKLLKETNDKNGVFSEEYQYIVKLYRKCQEDNDFLA